MKIYISVDIEGVAGIAHWDEATKTKNDYGEFQERMTAEAVAAAEGALRSIYNSVWLPRVEGGELAVERVEVGGRPLQSTGLHERVMELLTQTGVKRVHGSLMPHKIVERLKLGEGDPPRMGVKTSDVRDAFFSFIEPPRLESDDPIRKAIARGVLEGSFAYISGSVPTLGDDGKYQVNLERVIVRRGIADDEVDLESGFLMMPSALPKPPEPEPVGVGEEETEPKPPDTSSGDTGDKGAASDGLKRFIHIAFNATRDQIYNAFPAIANLADKSDGGKVRIEFEGFCEEGYEPSWLRNAVEEPLDEADVEEIK